jgi:hypothetical protein
MRIVGLAGKGGTGKDTLARLFLRPLGFMPVALADEIKIRAVATGVASYMEAFYTKPPQVRQWLQQEGTDRGRDVFGEDVWLRAMDARMRKVATDWGIDQFVVTDVRFANEVKFIRELGGAVFLLDAPIRNANNGMSAEARQHISENHLDLYCTRRDFNAVIRNDPQDADTVGWQISEALAKVGLLGARN